MLKTEKIIESCSTRTCTTLEDYRRQTLKDVYNKVEQAFIDYRTRVVQQEEILRKMRAR